MPTISSNPKLIVVLAVVLVLVIVLVGTMVGLPFQLSAYSANTTTQLSSVEGWVGTGNPAYGGASPGQLLDQTDYIASWSYNLLGQRVSTEGGVVIPNYSNCGLGAGSTTGSTWGYRLELYVPGSTPISGWNLELPHNQPITNYGSHSDFPDPNTSAGTGTIFTEPLPAGSGSGGSTLNAPAVYWDLTSPDGSTIVPEGSVIRSEFWVYFGCNVLAKGSQGWHLMAWDEARIHTGIGSASWDRSPALYGLGETASCSWTIGYVSDPQKGLGWSLFITSSGQAGKVVASLSSLSTLIGQLSYKVAPADLSGSRNKLICDLRNNLFDKDFSVAAVVWCTNCGPSLTVTGVSPQTPMQGQHVTVSWIAEPNPTTQRAIMSIEVVWGWGGPQNDVNLTGNSTSYSFLASQAGFVTVAVAAWDAGGNSSGFTNLKIAVNPQAANGGLGGGGPGSPVDLLIVGIVLLVIGVILVYVGIYAAPEPWMKVIAIIAGGSLAAIGAWLVITSAAALLAPYLGGLP